MKYIFWDFNGTVLDDAHLCYEILNEMLIEEERPIVTFEEYLMILIMVPIGLVAGAKTSGLPSPKNATAGTMTSAPRTDPASMSALIRIPIM